MRSELSHKHHKKDGEEHHDDDSCLSAEGESNPEKYLVWEPKSVEDKIFSLTTNIVENIFVMIVASAAIVHSSLVAIGFFLTANLFFISSTMD